jgi:nitrite reductase/ring-hydroxylating ferredoxin subunit
VAFEKIARTEDVPPGQTRFIVIRGKPLVLARWGGSIHALSGLCPHQSKPLSGARVWGGLLTCPWHNFQYDLRTGENHYPRNVYPPDLASQLAPLKTYPVEIRGNAIWVDLG